ncbi:hypothetical protein Hanom_Chr08g00687351 [Helianthus anomalus]
MELTSTMKMARFQTFWIQTRKNKPLDESRKNWPNLRDEKWYFTRKIIILPRSCLGLLS